MKITVLLLSFAFTCSSLSAQELTSSEKQTLPKLRTHELGAFTQFNFSPASPQGNLSLLGLQYNKWIKPTKGYRFFVSYGAYDSHDFTETTVKSDTAFQKAHFSHADLLVVGGAIQVQRQFYKKVYLFAALEMKAGYGLRELDTVTTKFYPYKQGGAEERTGERRGENNNMLYADLAPSIGAKIQFKHFCIGTELLFDVASYNSGAYPNGTNMSMLDLNLGKTSSRLFVNYRF